MRPINLRKPQKLFKNDIDHLFMRIPTGYKSFPQPAYFRNQFYELKTALRLGLVITVHMLDQQPYQELYYREKSKISNKLLIISAPFFGIFPTPNLHPPQPIQLIKYIHEMIKLQQNKSQIRPQQLQLHSQHGDVADVQSDMFQYLGLAESYHVNEIPVGEIGEVMKTIFIGQNERERVFYLGHGFGGTSYMYFPLFHQLLEKGNIVLWEIRGMGLNDKKLQYPDISQVPQEEIQNFYNEGLLKVVQYYKHKNIVFISHSFGAYITMKFAIKNQSDLNIERCILLSPIGVTPMETDYKNRCKSYKDIFYYVLSWFAWKFDLTYKSALKKLHGSLKRRLLKSFLSKFQLKGEQLRMTLKIFDVLTSLKGGSEKYFYRTFLPRVLPLRNKSIQEIAEDHSIQFDTVLIYGGMSDWVDKKGSKYLQKHYQKVTVKGMENCGHMLPLHTPAMKVLINEELASLK